MRFDPCVPHRTLGLAPAFPPTFGKVQIDNLSVDGFRIGLDIDATSASITGLPGDFRVTEDSESGRAAQAAVAAQASSLPHGHAS
jgi:hypothetical protein